MPWDAWSPSLPVIRTALFATLALVLFVAPPLAVAQASGPGVKSAPPSKIGQAAPKSSAKPKPKTDEVQGKLFLATLFSLGGGGENHPYLFVKSDGAQYEVALADKAVLPTAWLQKKDDLAQYPVTLMDMTIYTEPENLHVTQNPDGSVNRRLDIHDTTTDHEHHVVTLIPLIGRYSVRGRIVTPSQDGQSGQITASEIKFLGN